MAAMVTKILVPLDGSDLAAQALPYAQELATLSGAKLYLLQVVPSVTKEMELTVQLHLQRVDESEQEPPLNEAMGSLEEIVNDLKLHKIDAEAVVDVGHPAEKIVDYALDNKVDLIVMSTHGRTGIARWVYGSVANKVLQAASCPILLVRSALPNLHG